MLAIRSRYLALASATAVAVIMIAGTAAAPAGAEVSHASSKALATASCSTNPKLNGEEVLSVSVRRSAVYVYNSTIQLWYSPTCATAWAVEGNGLSGDKLWVYNEDTHVTRGATVPSSGTRTVTAAIDDSGTLSHACMENTASTFPPAMAKTCTGWY